MTPQCMPQKASSEHASSLITAVVTSHTGHAIQVEDNDGHLWRCSRRADLIEVVVGDHVKILPAEQGQARIEAVLERPVVLMRPTRYGPKPLCSHFTRVFVTIAIVPLPQESLLEQYLIALAYLPKGMLHILINKADLKGQWSTEQHAFWQEKLQYYQDVLAIPVHWVSSQSEQSHAHMLALCQNHTSLFIGPSGVGKSSLIHSLCPDADLAISALSDHSDLGQHTTTRSQRYALAEGGYVIDSPGVRQFGLYGMTAEKLLQGMPDLAALSKTCRFRNCQHHEQQLGCAFHQAVAQGTLPAWRLALYDKMKQQFLERR